MRPYLIALAIIALLVGSLFQAAEATNVRLMRMFGTMGIAFFGIVGSLMVTRWQSRSGLGAVEKALKSLEPECLITDWAFNRKGRPDYLVVAPGGLIAVCVDETAQSVKPEKAAPRIAKARERTKAAVRWVQDNLGDGAEIPVSGLLVLIRRQAEPDDSADGVIVVNPEALKGKAQTDGEAVVLDEQTRIRLTRYFRELAAG